MKNRFGQIGQHVAISSAVASLVVTACGGDVLVGETMEGTSSDTGGSGQVDGSDGCESCGGAGPAVDCSEQDSKLRAPLERWLATANHIGVLAGSTWEGVLSNGLDLLLTFDESGAGTFQVGTPLPPPMQDVAYVEPYEKPLPQGAVYDLHGAGFDGTELLIPLPIAAPYIEWCPLQVPEPVEGSDCGAGVLAGAVNCSGEVCTNGERTFTQEFVAQAGSLVCTCTRAECAANLDWPEWAADETYADHQDFFEVPALVLTYDGATDSFSGGYFPDGSPPEGTPIELERAD